MPPRISPGMSFEKACEEISRLWPARDDRYSNLHVSARYELDKSRARVAVTVAFEAYTYLGNWKDRREVVATTPSDLVRMVRDTLIPAVVRSDREPAASSPADDVVTAGRRTIATTAVPVPRLTFKGGDE